MWIHYDLLYWHHSLCFCVNKVTFTQCFIMTNIFCLVEAHVQTFCPLLGHEHIANIIFLKISFLNLAVLAFEFQINSRDTFCCRSKSPERKAFTARHWANIQHRSVGESTKTEIWPLYVLVGLDDFLHNSCRPNAKVAEWYHTARQMQEKCFSKA